MALIQIYVASEVCREIVGELAQLETVQFRDLNDTQTSFQRTFITEIRRLEAAKRGLNTLMKQLEVAAVPAAPLPDAILEQPLLPPSEVDDLLAEIEAVAAKITELANSRTTMEHRRDYLLEKRQVLRACEQFYSGTSVADLDPASFDKDNVPLLEAGLYRDNEDPLAEDTEAFNFSVRTSLLAGTIPRTKYLAFERIAWRVSRGNLYMTHFPIEQPVSGVYMDSFVCYTHGDATLVKIRRLAESMDTHLFDVDGDSELRKIELDTTNAQLTEIFKVLDSATAHLGVELELVANQLTTWQAMLAKESLVYQTLNMFSYDAHRRSLIAEGWVPRDKIGLIQATLARVAEREGVRTPSVVHEIQTTRSPPTYHRTNKFTAAFQAIVDVYGIASYQEVNAALPAIVTFPFMFAIMFGDVGHAIILSLAALSLVLRENTIAKMRRDEIFDMAFSGRYVLLLMGLFSLFTGLVYNDVFSKSMTIFSSGWKWPEHAAGETVSASFTGHTYPFGIDWAWHGAENNLLFTNSYKMKMSILMGFLHMTYSLVFQLVNALHFDSWVDVVGNFIPSVLFMQSIFGYLAATILYKWSVDWIGQNKPAPGLLDMLINMFLSPGTIEQQLYPGQKFVQGLLVLVALVCVPWLLLFKPLYLRRLNTSAQRQGYSSMQEQQHENQLFALEEDADEEMIIQDAHSEEAHEKFEFSEVMIHQVIHTIEFCLNCVSHTASYLRLWALSLAHNQLSSVLWDMTIQNAFGPTGAKGVVTVVCLFAMWFVGTVVVLVCMEGTSAMLHSLRLHWVEAMSKHFEGEGVAFQPLEFKSLQSQIE